MSIASAWHAMKSEVGEESLNDTIASDVRFSILRWDVPSRLAHDNPKLD